MKARKRNRATPVSKLNKKPSRHCFISHAFDIMCLCALHIGFTGGCHNNQSYFSKWCMGVEMIQPASMTTIITCKVVMEMKERILVYGLST